MLQNIEHIYIYIDGVGSMNIWIFEEHILYYGQITHDACMRCMELIVDQMIDGWNGEHSVNCYEIKLVNCLKLINHNCIHNCDVYRFEYLIDLIRNVGMHLLHLFK